MSAQFDVLSNAIFVTCSTSGLDLSSPIKGFCVHHLSCLCFIIHPCVGFADTVKRVLEALQHLVKAVRLCSGCAGPHSLGTGSVSGFGGLAAGGKSCPLGALTEQLDSYWNEACVCVSGIRICAAPGGLPHGLDGEPK